VQNSAAACHTAVFAAGIRPSRNTNTHHLLRCGILSRKCQTSGFQNVRSAWPNLVGWYV